MQKGTFVTIIGLVLVGSAIAATASQQPAGIPTGQVTPRLTPSPLGSMPPDPGPSAIPSASATPRPN